MKYREGTIPKTEGQLRDRIGDTVLRAPKRQFPDSYDFDGTFYSMARGVENLRDRFGDTKADQLLDMIAQAKAHYEAGENTLGGPLLQDAEMVIIDRQPWAYPKELYRWGEMRRSLSFLKLICCTRATGAIEPACLAIRQHVPIPISGHPPPSFIGALGLRYNPATRYLFPISGHPRRIVQTLTQGAGVEDSVADLSGEC